MFDIRDLNNPIAIKAYSLENIKIVVHSPQANSTRKVAVCLHAFISICADAKRPNG